MFVAKNCCHIFNCRRVVRPGSHGVLLVVLPLLMLVGAVTGNAQQPAEFPEDRLTLATAVQLALRMDDPALQRLELRAQALEEAAVADAQLPDPMITGQMANVPTDSFRFDRDGMTQAVRVGLRQEFPAGKTLAIKGQRRRDEAAVQRSNRSLELERIRLETRQLWFSLFYHDQAVHIIQRSRKAVAEQIDSLVARFATGRMNAQDVLRTELELALLDDQITEHQRQADVQRAGLARWIGTAAQSTLPDKLPVLPEPPALQDMESELVNHPTVVVEDAQAAVVANDIRLAEQAYKPAWALEGGYGLRTERPDLASVGLTLSLPLFTSKRQDRRWAAAVQQHSAELLDRDLLLLELRRDLQQTWADWGRLNERVRLYRQAVGERAQQTAEASMTTYANNQTDFAELIRSQLAELEVELKRVELETDAAQAWARLAYLAGEPS